MRDDSLFPLPIAAEVRPAEDLATLAQQANENHALGEDSARKGLENFRAAGEALLKAKSMCGHGKWLPWLKKSVRFSQSMASKYMRVAANWVKLETSSNLADALRLLTEDAPEEDDIVPDAAVPEYITLDQWNGMSKKDRKAALAIEGGSQFNSQGNNDSIEWALWSWNPVTGCNHNCPYCYARDIATNGPTANAFPNGFAPTFIPKRLKATANTSFPEAKIAAEKEKNTPEGDARALGLGNVFVCSMADLFGRWVPTEWIDAVLAEVRAAPQWNFLFLTKFPIRMAEFDFPENAWVGTTVDCQARVANAEKSFAKIKAGVKWLSCEPLIEPLRFSNLAAFNWIVLGGASASSQTPEWNPPREWFARIEDEAKAAGCRIYEKSNLLGHRIRQYPGQDLKEETLQAPEALRYLPTT